MDAIVTKPGAKRNLVPNPSIKKFGDFGELTEVGVLTSWLPGARVDDFEEIGACLVYLRGKSVARPSFLNENPITRNLFAATTAVPKESRASTDCSFFLSVVGDHTSWAGFRL